MRASNILVMPSQMSNLKQRKKSKHEKVRYPCEQCTFTASKPSHVKRHKKTKHDDALLPHKRTGRKTKMKARTKMTDDMEIKGDISEDGWLVDPTSLLEQQLGIHQENVKQEGEDIFIKEEIYESEFILS